MIDYLKFAVDLKKRAEDSITDILYSIIKESEGDNKKLKIILANLKDEDGCQYIKVLDKEFRRISNSIHFEDERFEELEEEFNFCCSDDGYMDFISFIMTLDRSIVEDMVKDAYTGFKKHHDLFVNKQQSYDGQYFLNQREGFWTYAMFSFD